MNEEQVKQLREDEAAMEEQLRQDRLNELYDLARIPVSLRKVNSQTIEDRYEHKHKVQEWMNRIEKAFLEKKTEYGLYLHGPYGTGKTSIAAGLGMWASRNGVYSLFLRFPSLADLKYDNPVWHEDVPERGIWDYAKKVPLLIVDDVFRHRTEKSGKANAVILEELLEERMGNRKLLHIFTSNLSVEELDSTPQERLGRLFTQSCYLLEVTGTDFRNFIKTNRKAL